MTQRNTRVRGFREDSYELIRHWTSASATAMNPLPTEWTALCALVFLLGLKHGFDADHLATIDGLTRYNARHGRRFGRYCGALFSLGHGTVVLIIAAAVGLVSERWNAPEWLEAFGAWTSILFLTLIG